jgi:hypothetical protein
MNPRDRLIEVLISAIPALTQENTTLQQDRRFATSIVDAMDRYLESKSDAEVRHEPACRLLQGTHEGTCDCGYPERMTTQETKVLCECGNPDCKSPRPKEML